MLEGQKVCILGLGLSGISAARLALSQGASVTIYGGASSEASRKAAVEFTDAGVEVIFDDELVKGPFDLCVVCPGIPQVSAFYQNALAASTQLVSEPEFAWRFSPEGWVAVSGTNGKTTTTTLIAHLLKSCGKPAALCGNTQATTVTDAVRAREEGEALVAELSSFQLASTLEFAPRVAVLLNITSDHLAWHGSQQAYADAKLKLFDNLAEGSCAVVTESVPGWAERVEGLRERGVRALTVGAQRAADCAYAGDDGMLHYVDAQGVDTVLARTDDLQIKGSHNIENALAAAAAAISFGCAPEAVGAALTGFEPLEHRIQPVGTVDGVAFYDDSKATNVDATLKALTAFPDRKVILMLGGRDKGTDLTQLVAAAEEACAGVVCYGEGGPRFQDAFSTSCLPHALMPGFDDAFDAACSMAQPGQVVLLSPACASFDEFTGFVARGQRFAQLVSAREAL